MLPAMLLVFDANVIKPRHMKILDEAVVIGGALFPLF
jgi:hypothetical protein